MQTLSVNLPFEGFYYSIWDQEIDSIAEREAEWMAEREEEDGVAPAFRLDASEFASILFDVTDHSAIQREVAGFYCEAFEREASERLGFTLGLKFEEMTSPKYYNFETDRIFADVSWLSMARLFVRSRKENHARLEKLIAERFTSRSGFISHYSNDLADWLEKPLADWDHNELGTLLRAMLDCEDDDFRMALYYDVCEGDGIFSAHSNAVDWEKFAAKVQEARDEKREALAESDPETLAKIDAPAEWKANRAGTIDLFTGEVG